MSQISIGGVSASGNIVDEAEQTIKRLNDILDDVPDYLDGLNKLTKSNQKDIPAFFDLTNGYLDDLPKYLDQLQAYLSFLPTFFNLLIGYLRNAPENIDELKSYFVFLPTFFNLLIGYLKSIPENIDQLKAYFAFLPTFFNLVNDYLKGLPQYIDQLKDSLGFIPTFFGLANGYLTNLPQYVSQLGTHLAVVSTFFTLVNGYLTSLPQYFSQLGTQLAPVSTFFTSANGYLTDLPQQFSQLGVYLAAVTAFFGLVNDYLRQLPQYISQLGSHLTVVSTFFTLVNGYLNQLPQYVSQLGSKIAFLPTFFNLVNEYLSDIGTRLSFIPTFFNQVNTYLSNLPQYISQLGGQLVFIQTFFSLANDYLANIGANLDYIPKFFNLVNGYLSNIGTSLAFLPTFFNLLNGYLSNIGTTLAYIPRFFNLVNDYLSNIGTNLAYIPKFFTLVNDYLSNIGANLAYIPTFFNLVNAYLSNIGTNLAYIPTFFGLVNGYLSNIGTNLAYIPTFFNLVNGYLSNIGTNLAYIPTFFNLLNTYLASIGPGLAFLATFFTLVNGYLSNLPGYIAQLGSQLAVIPAFFILVNGYLKDLPQYVKQLGDQLAVVPSLLNSLNLYLQGLVSTLSSSGLISSDKLKSYCNVTGSADGFSLLSIPNKLLSDGKLDKSTLLTALEVQAGVPVTLTALAPVPGATLPSLPGLPASLLPSTCLITFQWHIYLLDGPDDNGNWKRADAEKDLRPGAFVDDQAGAFDLVSGDLTSPAIGIVPWPDPVHNTIDGVVEPSQTKRGFCAFVDIKFWWPGLPQPLIVSTDPIYFSVQSWYDTLDGKADATSKTWMWDSSKAPSAGQVDRAMFFRDLFQVTADNLTPNAGDYVTASIKPVNSKPQFPQTITSLVQTEPTLTIQAGVDIGAIINNIGNAIIGLGGKTPENFSGAVTVGNVLSKALSLPLAVAVNGSSVSKTIVPNSPITLPTMGTLPDSSGMSGIIPLGKLMTRLETTLDNQNVNIGGAEGIVQSGLQFLLIPTITDLRDGEQAQPELVTISVSIKAKLLVPGASEPMNLSFSAGTLRIARPVISLPQIALLFKDALTASETQDILIVPDPPTRKAFNTIEAVTAGLGALKSVLDKLSALPALPTPILRPVVPSVFGAMPDIFASIIRSTTPFYQTIDPFHNLADTVSLMVTLIQNANANGKTLRYMDPYTSGNGLFYTNSVGAELPWWEGTQGKDHGGNISAFLWIGAAMYAGYQMFLGFDDYTYYRGKFVFPPQVWERGIYSLRFKDESNVDYGLYFVDQDKSEWSSDDLRLVGPGWSWDQVIRYGWNDRIRWVEFRPIIT